ncbi:hypothetical protein SERLA73DRAFT_190564 [Serpula lacrymans var. lacrymans S7.3]|uniref:Eukaryotic translation initiation factor 4G1 eIF4E-binding domain-containing protein n=2 Tax=Serpula lacrymans var. lacrymans TaxID=341189 RepID=F8QFY1_SERL3|nr:uncharacterized protein SERLADRAFT_463411 [Serpula lacrymans var. lacrymans S7.9]EGN92729.1 hypothetical protein SERLA73DRAFT_190564 [Serpula lacrymans var. lacrymans S7.3]EGO26390.1 hypothetical protein SERLADRAFT_463411 [Serpula lacrymans var. lacrymans S7.9]
MYTSIGTEVDPMGIDISTTSPLFHGRPRPGPPAMSSSRKDVLVSLPSVYATAQFIQDLGQIKYPDGIKSPEVELNVNAKDGKFRYDRDFLLQFMPLCKEKPNTVPLSPLGLTPVDSLITAHDDSGRHRPMWGTQSKQVEEGNAANKAMRSKRTRTKRGEKPVVHPTQIALDSATTISSSSARSDMLFDSVVPLELKS